MRTVRVYRPGFVGGVRGDGHFLRHQARFVDGVVRERGAQIFHDLIAPVHCVGP